MATGYVLYNTKAGTLKSLESVKNLEKTMKGPLKFLDIEDISDYRVFLTGLEPEDYLVLAGGDGTLNCFVNNIKGIEFHNEVLYFPNGTGNDFAHDAGHEKECTPFPITEQIKNLPTVTVNGETRLFVNGIGYGIDGYCCQVGDEKKQIPGKKVNYTTIAIGGLLFHYRPTKARVTVDGKTSTYESVWFVPTMNGRFYGGGMMPTPNQKRNSGTLSAMVFHNAGKLKTLSVFPSLFKGKHVQHKESVEILEGKEITVEFDRPVPLQIDGETVLNVASYTAKAANM